MHFSFPVDMLYFGFSKLLFLRLMRFLQQSERALFLCDVLVSKQLDKPLSNMKILILGKLSRNKEEMKTRVEELGGKVTGTANKANLCISTQSEQTCNITVILGHGEELDHRGDKALNEDLGWLSLFVEYSACFHIHENIFL